MTEPSLYTYFRSGAAHRVRIGLALKQVAYHSVPVDLLQGAQRDETYRAINPQSRLPSLRLPQGDVLIQSPAILEYLEETIPNPALLPADPLLRAKVRGVAAIIGCDIHPLNNVAVLNKLRGLGHDETVIKDWIGDWIGRGFVAVEALIGGEGWCFGPTPGMADVYLVPQIFAARRFKLGLEAFPKIARIEALAAADVRFQAASPQAQADAK